MDLTNRNRQDELMDQPGLDENDHRQALAGLQRVNWISFTASGLWKEIIRIVQRRKLEKVQLLDVACGGGDLATWIACQGERKGLKINVDGLDISPTAVVEAQRKAATTSTSNVRFLIRDVLSEPLETETGAPYDIVMSSLFFHHLEIHQTVNLLQKMVRSARHAVIIDDLRRTQFGYYLAYFGCRILSRSRIVHVDASLSAQAAYTSGEMRSLVKQAKIENFGSCRIVNHWPQRLRLIWQRTEEGEKDVR